RGGPGRADGDGHAGVLGALVPTRHVCSSHVPAPDWPTRLDLLRLEGEQREAAVLISPCYRSAQMRASDWCLPAFCGGDSRAGFALRSELCADESDHEALGVGGTE